VSGVTSPDSLTIEASSSVNHVHGEIAVETSSANQIVINAGNSSTAVTSADIHAIDSSCSAHDAISEVAGAVDTVETTSSPLNSAIIAGTSKTFYSGIRPDSKQNKHGERRVSVIDISPIPLPCQKESKRKVRQKRSEIITASPMKQILHEKDAKQVIRKEKLVKQQEAVKEMRKRESEAKRAKKRKLNLDKLNTSSEKPQHGEKALKKNLSKVSTNRSKNQAKRKSVKVSADKDTTPCGTCAIRHCDDEAARSWIQCQRCEIWYHNECQGLDERGPKTFECILCENAE